MQCELYSNPHFFYILCQAHLSSNVTSITPGHKHLTRARVKITKHTLPTPETNKKKTKLNRESAPHRCLQSEHKIEAQFRKSNNKINNQEAKKKKAEVESYRVVVVVVSGVEDRPWEAEAADGAAVVGQAAQHRPHLDRLHHHLTSPRRRR